MKVLVTCPPMLGMMSHFMPIFESKGVSVTAPDVVQTLSIQELKEIVPAHDGWIIGDDPATREVFESGKKGKLKAAVKWGIGVDNVNFEACRELDITIVNTPNMFGAEVADTALGYVIALARETFQIDQGVRQGKWPKPRGISLYGKTAAIIGFGDIGQNLSHRLKALGLKIIAYDPHITFNEELKLIADNQIWPDKIEQADFIIFTCALTKDTKHLFNSKTIKKTKEGVRIINVARGPIIDEEALIGELKNGHIYSCALDVFETEPLPLNSYLRIHSRTILGSHNASNTEDAVIKTSNLAISKLLEFLNI